LREADLAETRRIIRVAFGTFIGVPDPENFRTDIDAAGTRWLADPSAVFAAEVDGELVGSNFATRWGSVGFFGPLTVRPDLWNKGIAQRLMEPVMESFARWKVTHAGLFTFAQSAKHVRLYQKSGFWPRFLIAVMSKSVDVATAGTPWSKYSELPETERKATLAASRELTNSIYPGLDLEREIRAVFTQQLGETVLISDQGRLAAFAVCHCGPGTEAGDDKCYIKFAAARSEAAFDSVLDAVEALASSRGLSRIEAGMSLARPEAYRKMIDRGFRTDIQGVAMHTANEPGYHRAGVYVIDDWR
jgi:GNAT superfamily N-acetyltransferase